MIRKKQHFLLCGFLIFFCLNVNAANIIPPKTTHANLIDSVFLHLSSASANVGDVISISVKVGNFNNLDQLNFNVNWNAAYLEFQSVSDFGMPSISNTNFNTLSTPSGKLLFFWIPPSPQSLSDSTILFKINLKIKSYSGLPIPVFVTNTSAYNDLGLSVAVSSRSGSVKVNNNGNCAGRPAGMTCAMAPLLCAGDFPYCNTLPRDNATFTQPTPCGSIENYHFIQFEAATDEITFRVKASNCDGGNGGNGVGVQIRIYETSDCQIFKIKYCRSAIPISPGSSDTVALKELVVGSRYYFMVDGQKGDVCDYLISVESGSVGGKPIVTASNINGATSVCKNATNNAYTVSNTTEAIAYEWKTTNGGVISSGQNTPSVSVNWGAVSDSICIKIVGNCFESDWACKAVTISPPVESNLDATICSGSTYNLGSQTFNTAGNYRVTFPNASYKGCDSIVNLNLKVLDIQISASKSNDISCKTPTASLNGSSTVSPNSASVSYEWKNAANTVMSNSTSATVSQSGTYTFTVKAILNGMTCQKSTQVTISAAPPQTEGNVSAAICSGSTYPLGGQTFNTTGNYKVTLANANYLGCDSVVNLDLKVIDIQTSSSKSGDLSCETQSVTLTGSATVSPNNASLTYEWKNTSNAIVSNALSLIVNQSGIYTFTVKAILNGSTCEKSSQVTVLKTGNGPSRPELQGDVISCENKTVNYNIVNIASGVSKYNWFITNGTITSGVSTPSVSVAWGQSSTGKVCVNAENGCSVSDTTCLTIEVGKIPNTVIISGSATVCPASVATYNISPTIGNVNYQWTVPSGATIKKGQNTPTIDVDWGNSLGGQVCVTPSNYCGLATQSCFNVTVKNAPPDSTAIKSPATVCPNAIDTLSVAPDAGIIEYVWTAPSNATIVSGQGTPSVIVRFNSGSEALFSLQIKNTCNLTKQMSRLVKIKSVLPDSLPILGNLTACSNDTSSFGVSGNSSIISYLWSVPAGATIINGQGTMTIQVAWGIATGGKIGVELTNACQLKRQILSDNIVLKNSAIDKPTIVGSSDNCPNSKSNYSVTANPKYTRYTWTIPSNGTLLSGQGTNAIQVQWNNTGSSNICIEVENDCRIKTTECLPITVKTGIDSLQITGPNEVCSGGTAVFTAQRDPDAVSYLWSVPSGATILTGRGTNSISVQFGTTAGKVLILPIGGCATNSSQINVTIKQAPNSPASVRGKAAVCQGEIEKYTAAPVVGIRRYNWSVPAGASIVGNDSTNEITVRWVSGTGGLVRVKTQNDCAESAEKNMSVAVSSVPKPNAGKDDSICGRQYILRGVSSVGTGTWTIVEKPSASTLTFLDDKNPKTTITASKSGKYVLKFEEINNSCSAADSVVINFKENPQLTLINDDCNSEGSQYTLKININNGTAPFTFSGGLVGTIQGNNFTSSPIANGASYIFSIKDAFGCLADTLRGKKTCPCYTQAAVLKDNALNLCYGLTGKTEVTKAPVLDGDDGFEFVLHSGSINGIGTILLRNNTGEFAFDASKMQYGKMYFIHQIAGNLTNGLVNSTDRCYVVSNGTSITFKDKIVVNLKGDTSICSNATATLVFKTTDKGVFNIVYKNQNQSQIFNSSNIKNNSLINVIPSVSSTYKLTEAADATGCKAEIMDSVQVNLRAKPSSNAGVDKTICVSNSSLDATISPPFVGTWKGLSGATILDLTNPKTEVKNLVNGKNIFVFTVKDSFCPAFQALDSVSIFLPLLPKAVNLALEMTAGDTISAKVVEEAPAGTYSVTRIDNPAEGRFDLFSNGQFNYISNPNFAGVVRFRVMICSEACTRLCDTGEVRILIRPKVVKPQQITIEVPNAITPNEDGKNDALVIDNIEKYPQNELIIFNRWGDILYKAKPYANDWNGTNQQGQPLPEGTYYYLLRLDINNGKILRGDMTILR